MFSLTTKNVFDLEKALKEVKDSSSKDGFEIFQSLNIESIVDQTNKNYLDFKKFSIKSDADIDKIRLRAFTLRINKRTDELESNSEQIKALDKAFETLNNTESLETLKSKIKSGYQDKFSGEINEEPEFATQQEEESTVYGTDEETRIEEESPILAPEKETEFAESNDIQELDDFIHDFGNNKEDLPVSSEISTSEAVNNDQQMEEDTNHLASVSDSLHETELLDIDSIENNKQNAEESVSEAENPVEELIDTPKQVIMKRKKTTRNKTVTKEMVKAEPSSIEFVVLFESQSVDPEIPNPIMESDSKVVYSNKSGEILSNESNKKPEMVYLKIPKDDRFLILLLNPKEYLSAHIYGRWKIKPTQKYKVLLSEKIGLWHIRIQYLESGKTFDLDFSLN